MIEQCQLAARAWLLYLAAVCLYDWEQVQQLEKLYRL